MKIVYGLLCISCIITGCSRGTEQNPASMQENSSKTVQGAAQREDAALPVVTYAEIITTKLISDKYLSVQYAGQDSSGRPIVYRFRWYVDGSLIPEADRNVLDSIYVKKGTRVEAEVIPSCEGVEGRAFRTAAVTIKNTSPFITSITFVPLPAHPGDQLTAVPEGEDRDNETITYLYQWRVNDKDIPGANGPTFDTTALKKKDRISINITPFDGEDYGKPFMSIYAVLSNRHPDIVSTPPSGIENGIYLYQVIAKDPDGDPLTFRLLEAPSGMTIHPSTGMLRWEAPKQIEKKQEVTVKVSVDDGDGGQASQEFSLTLEVR